MIRLIITILPLILALLIIPNNIYALDCPCGFLIPDPTTGIRICKPCPTESVNISSHLGTGENNFFKFECLNELIVNGIKSAVILGSVAFFVLLVVGGLQWLTSGGDKNNVEAARNRITSALVGITILALSYAIWNLVLYFFGLSGDICNPIGTPPSAS